MKSEQIGVQVILAVCLILASGAAAAQSVTVDYGVVTSEKAIELSDADGDKKLVGTAAGGLLGGVIGYAVGKGSSKGKKIRGILLGGTAGALAGREFAKSTTKAKANEYTVELNSGDSVQIATEQGRIDVGDCVTVERGESANIRRVSQVHCQDKNAKPSEEHLAEAKECEAAKAALNKAETDEAMAAAVETARLRCEE